MTDKRTLYSESGETYKVDAEPGRNDPCPCRSGKKYKHCCGQDGAHT